jgi:hypothetical protein
MTAAQERRLLHAALGFASTDLAVRALKRRLKAGEDEDADGTKRMTLFGLRYRWKQKLIRAAGLERRQMLLPLEKNRIIEEPKPPKARPMYGPRSGRWKPGSRIEATK